MGITMTNGQLLTPKEAAKYLNISVSTLAKNRMCTNPIPFVKLGRSVRYELEALNDCIQRNRKT